MRKVVLGVLLLVVVAGGAYVLSRFWGRLFPPFPEKIFPENTLVYGYIHDLNQARKGVRQTLLWKNLDRSSSLSLDRQLDRAFVMVENTTGIDIRPLLDQMTGDAAVGIFPVPDGRRGGAFQAYVADETKTRELIEQDIDPGLRRRMPDLKKTEAHHGNITYYKYSSLRFPSKFSPCYFLSDHHLVLAGTEASVQALMNVLDGKAPPLNKSGLFQGAKRGLDYRRGVLAYVNLREAFGLVRTSLPPTAERMWPAILKITGLDALQSFSYCLVVKEDGFSEAGFISVGENPVGLLKIYMGQQPQKMVFPSAAPSNSKVVSVGTLPDFAKMWDEVNARLKSVLSPSEFQKWQQGMDFLKGVLNFDIRRDLLDTLGDQFGMAYEPAVDSRADPGNVRWLLALKLKKPDQFKDTLDRLVSLASTLQSFKRSEQEYKGKKVVTLEGSIGGTELSPAFVFDDSWFYFATRQDLLKKSMDTDRSTSILTRKDYKKVTSGFPARVNGLSYTDVQAYLQAYAAMMEKQADSGQNPWMEGSKLPQDLSNLSKGLYGSGAYFQIQRKGIYYRSFSSVPSSFLALPALVASYPKLLEEYNSH
jgi:hypothetical protein